MQINKIQNRIKQIIIVLKFIPILLGKLKDVWEVTKQYYNEETMKELKNLSKNKEVK